MRGWRGWGGWARASVGWSLSVGLGWEVGVGGGWVRVGRRGEGVGRGGEC